MKIRLLSLSLMMTLVCGVTFAQRQKPAPKPAPKTSEQQRPLPDKNRDDDDAAVLDETVRLGTELVNVLFSVVDPSNHVIGDVREEEVAILEDGIPQHIFTFKREATLPINIAILMDLSGSQEYTFPKAKSAAGQFLRSVLRPGKDAAALLTFQDDVDLVQGLTSRLDSIGRAFDEMEFNRRFAPPSSRKQATALYDAVYITADEVLSRGDRRRLANDEDFTRKAIILLTDGVDNASTRGVEDVINRAWRAGVVIYAIGIGDRFRFEGVREDILRRLSEETGGRAYFPLGPDDLIDDFRQIDTELRSQYLVAYSPSNLSRDGSFRRIEVRIEGRSDVRIVHRRGYYAPSEVNK